MSPYRATNLINIKKCQTNLNLSLFFAWSAAMHISWNIRNFAHGKRVQSPQVSTGFFSTPVIGGSVAEWSARRTRNPGSWVRVPLWPLAGFVLGRPEFISSATLVNSQLVASCQLGFLILLCCIWSMNYFFLSIYEKSACKLGG